MRREALGKTVRGFADDLDVTPAYISDIEHGNRRAPENYLVRMIEVLQIDSDEVDYFHDLAGKDRRDVFPDLTPYIGEKPIARAALRKARDHNIPDSQWQDFMDRIDKTDKEDM